MDSRPRGVAPATAAQALAVAEGLAPEHRREIVQLSGLAPGVAVALSVAESVEAYAYAPGGIGAAVFMMGVGAASPLTGSAVVWMLGTPGMRRHAAAVVRAARWGLARAVRVTGAAELEQYIPDWYRTGLRFVLRLGFAVAPPALAGRDGRAVRRVVYNAARTRTRQSRKGTAWVDYQACSTSPP